MVELPNVGCFLGLLGSLSSDDYEASENVDKKKMNLRPCKRDRFYLDPFNLSNVGNFSWS